MQIIRLGSKTVATPRASVGRRAKRLVLSVVPLMMVLPSYAQQATPADDPPANPSIVAETAKTAYVIGPTDVLSISVWDRPELSETIPVRPDGMVSMPLLGDLQAAGSTPMQFSDLVITKLKRYILDPRVSIVVTAVNSQRVFLLGEIAHAGPVSLTPGMTALQAISSGGGLTQFAHESKIYVLRSEGGKQQKIAVKYKQALKGELDDNVVLKSGDTIVVP